MPSSIEAIRSETSGFPVSALVASIAMFVTDAKVALLNRTSPVPGSAIDVELSNVYFHATAPTAPVASVAELAALVAELAALVAEVLALLACVVAVEAEEEAEVAEVADAVAEVALAVADVAAAVADVAAFVAEVVAEAASTINAHFATSELPEMGCEPDEVCAVIQI